MAIESASFITQLDPTNPKGTDQVSTLDNHARLVKQVIVNTLPKLDSTVSATPAALNFCIGLTANAQAQINGALSAISALSQSMITDLGSVSAALQASLLDLSGTAADSDLWAGAKRFVQTATPSLGEGDIWFKPVE